jgi:XTP/dITP diphosphohydrolase
MKKKLLIATKNEHKIKELYEIMGYSDWNLLTCNDFPDYPDIEETGNTFEENALLKAKTMAEFTGELTVADDSGLEIDYLDGLPGIMSARFAGTGAGFSERNKKVLGLLENVPYEKRTARFVCVAALAWPSGRYEYFKGICEGLINFAPQGENGFGYDPIFFIPSMNCTMAELSADIKNAISHRGLAFKKLIAFFNNYTP